MIHVDVWGSFKIPTHNGCKFFLTIVDDFTRMTWVFLLQYKSDVITILPQFFQYIENHFQASVKYIRTGNAPELCEGPLKQLYLNKGIINHKSCVNTPQQNGVVERKHKHLLEVSRALFFQAKLPSQFWGECLLCAAHLINRMPLTVLQHTSPFEKLFGHSPHLDYLRTFGCLCFVSTPKHNRSKFQPKATPHVFIGYPSGQKAYKVLNLDTLQITVSRDVVFQEQHFPFHYSSPNSSSPFQFFLPITTDYIPPSFDDIPDVFQFSSDSSLNTLLHSSPLSSPSLISNSNSPSISSDPSPPITSPPLFIDTVVDLSQVLPLRKSSRPHVPPSHLSDYVCHTATSASPWCALIAFHDLPSPHIASISLTESLTEPLSYKEAVTDPRWIDAMNAEILALEKNHTWILVDLPPSKKPIGSKWVYKIKHKSDGSIERFKARLVAKGYNQQWGIDFEETFSPVIKMTTVRCLIIALAASRNWSLFQLDVNNAFLHGDLK